MTATPATFLAVSVGDALDRITALATDRRVLHLKCPLGDCRVTVANDDRVEASLRAHVAQAHADGGLTTELAALCRDWARLGRTAA
jgi:hypothetical protein